MDQDWTQDKSSRIAEDFSTAELLFGKHRTGPCFVFRETDTRFIFSANLKGYKRANIKVKIDKGRKRVAVIGEKSVEGTAVVGNKVYTKEIETRGFKRAFHFSDGVIFNEMKASFNEQEFLLTICIPKMKRGFRVTRIEEVTHEEIGGTYEPLHIEVKEVDEKETLEINKHREEDVKEEKIRDKDVGRVYKVELEKMEDVQEFDQTRIEPVQMFKDKRLDGKQGSIDRNEAVCVQEPNNTREFEKKEEKRGIESEGEGEGTKKDECPKTKKNCELCNPVILGSTILVSISVLFIFFIRTQNQQRKKKN